VKNGILFRGRDAEKEGKRNEGAERWLRLFRGGDGDFSGAEEARGEEEDGLEEGEDGFEGDADEAERDGDQPHEGKRNQGQQSERPAQDKENTPTKK